MSGAPPPRTQAGSRRSKRRAVPSILQQEATECGAASLAMVLASYHRWVSLEELRETCGAGRDGVKALDILKTARAQGLVAKAVRRDLDTLGGFDLPAILFWNFNHFVVLELVDQRAQGRIRIVDPAVGPRTISLQEFDEAFTGIVLLFEPGPDFLPLGMRKSLTALISGRIKGFGHGFGFFIGAGVLLLVPGVLSAGFSRIFVDEIAVAHQSDLLRPLACVMAGAALIKALLVFMQQSILTRTHAAIAISAASAQMWTVLHLSTGFFSQRFASDIAGRFAMVDRLSGLLTFGLAPAAVGVVSLLGYGAALLLLDPVLAAIATLCAVIACLVLAASAKGMEDGNRRMVGDELRLGAATLQGVTMVNDFKATGTEGLLVSRWAGLQAKVVDAEQAISFRSSVLGRSASVIMMAAGAAVLVVGGLRVMDGAITIGVLLAFQTLLGSFTGPVLSLIGVGGQLQQVRGLAERLDDITYYHGVTRRQELGSGETVLPGRDPVLAMAHVDFAYSANAPNVISDLSMTLAPGMRIALVGGSGSGKSTIGKLLVGLVSPRSGEVTLGGRLLEVWPTVLLRKSLAYVDQTIGLFEGSFRDNVVLWDKTISDERIVQACRDAGVHDFIASRPGGYDGRVLEGGGNLSGGECQGLAIARALVINPEILVLDEATSALDPPVEEAIMTSIRRRGCSCVIIAHRLSSIRDCDAIYVVHEGRIVERGSHGELMKRGGAYSRLIET